MAFPTICDPCFDSDHDHCDEKVETSKLQVDREKTRALMLCGGGFCICNICRPSIKTEWHDHVREQVRVMREKQG